MSDIILSARNLTKHFVTARPLFGNATVVRAVDGVSLDVARGETLAIVGESGCGKSTLGRLLLRLIEPTAGDVTFEGRQLLTLSRGEMRKIRKDMQIVFQDPFASLNPRMKVGDIVTETLWIAGMGAAARREKARDLLVSVGLRAEHADRYPHEFSGGQRQRIGIARAISGGPTLLIGDEPVSALDVSVQAQIVNLLEDLKARLGLTLVIIAHDLAIIRHMSDRVVVMYLGQIVEIAPVGSLYERPLHPYTQALLSAIPLPSPSARGGPRALLEGDIPSPANPPAGCRFHTRCPHAQKLCSDVVPPLEDVGEGRAVACHFWNDIAAPSSVLRDTAPSPARARRMALYAQARAAAPT